MMRKNNWLLLFCMLLPLNLFSQNDIRQHISFDEGWRFAFGHPYDTKKDFNNGTGYFSYLTKTGYGDGAAAAAFDDRAWRKIDLPHDWAVEQPFSKTGSFSHGFKAIGRNFPDASVGWYRKTFTVGKYDAGSRISIAFDGVFRNSIYWLNGHYLGTHASGYLGTEYDITDYLNYDGENVIAVRVDATMEEGWFYEGAGIYRHTWLNKTSKTHIVTTGCFVDTKSIDSGAKVVVHAALKNEMPSIKNLMVMQAVKDIAGNTVASTIGQQVVANPYNKTDLSQELFIANPVLWSVETPVLYTLETKLYEGDKLVDAYSNQFGIRTLRFDANEGFFLNGKHLKIKGTNNHQDHAGVGTALPDSLQYFRIQQLKSFGSNAYRCSHHPPAPELLDACDRLGMLVIDENRLMGITANNFDALAAMINRDRHHPSVISWSIGNEEWGIEGNTTGARIAATMQAFVKSMDSTRAITAAVSGGWRKGISNVIDVMGYNYIGQINTDEHHAEFPNQPSWGTEEGSTRATRGVYVTDNNKQLIAAYDQSPSPTFVSIENGWKHYASRNYLGGMFIWTGFDYRGEPTPYGWPSTGSYFGMLDQCGFPKDNVYYLRSWWTSTPTLHILPHWNWTGREGQEIAVWVYSNCDAVELFLNKKSLGKQNMQPNSHLEWKVKYAPGTLEAVGYKNGRINLRDKVQTTGEAMGLQLASGSITINKAPASVAMITVSAADANGLKVPDASNEVSFTISGPGKIIGVGNGDPTSLEADKYIDKIETVPVNLLKEKIVTGIDVTEGVAENFNDASWSRAFKDDRNASFGEKAKAVMYRGEFILPDSFNAATIRFYYKSIGTSQTIFINGKQLAAAVPQSEKGNEYLLDASLLQAGKNTIAIAAVPLLKKYDWDNINTDAGSIQLLTPAPVWKRKLFNGLIQLIVQPTGAAGSIVINAVAPSIKPGKLVLKAE